MAYFLCFPGSELRIAPGESLIGRERACHVCIEDGSVSRRHARVLSVADVVTIVDLGSKNGVRVNGVKVEGAMQLDDGDLVTVGSRDFSVRRSGAFDTMTGEKPEPYRMPHFRTCTACKTLTAASTPQCAKCGATTPAIVDKAGAPLATYVSQETTVDGTLSELTTAGAFLNGPIADATGTFADLVFRTHGGGQEPIAIDTEVIRVSMKPRGVGLRFLRPSRAAQRFLLSIGAGTPA